MVRTRQQGSLIVTVTSVAAAGIYAIGDSDYAVELTGAATGALLPILASSPSSVDRVIVLYNLTVLPVAITAGAGDTINGAGVLVLPPSAVVHLLGRSTVATDWVGVTGPFSPTAGASGTVQAIQVSVGFAGPYDSVAAIPTGASVVNVQLDVTVAYDAVGTTLEVTAPTAAVTLMASAENTPTAINLYAKEQRTPIAPASIVRVTVGGGPTVGAAVAIVFYTIPAV